jgi:hypothetical protein
MHDRHLDDMAQVMQERDVRVERRLEPLLHRHQRHVVRGLAAGEDVCVHRIGLPALREPLIARQERLTHVHRCNIRGTSGQRIENVEHIHRRIEQPAEARQQPLLELGQIRRGKQSRRELKQRHAPLALGVRVRHLIARLTDCRSARASGDDRHRHTRRLGRDGLRRRVNSVQRDVLHRRCLHLRLRRLSACVPRRGIGRRDESGLNPGDRKPS